MTTTRLHYHDSLAVAFSPTVVAHAEYENRASVLLDEGDGIAAFFTAETMEVTVIVHVERRGFLVVEGAQALVGVAAGGLELNVPLDELDDVDPVSDLLERFRGD